MILSYGKNNNDSFSLDSDSKDSSDPGSNNNNGSTKAKSSTEKNVKNPKTDKNDSLVDEFFQNFNNMKLSSDPRKKKDEKEICILDANKSDKFLSIESISNINTNPHIDLDVSDISDSKTNDKIKKQIGTSYSSSSFTNIINNLNQENEEEKDGGNFTQVPTIKKDYDNMYLDIKNKNIAVNAYSGNVNDLTNEEKNSSISKENDFIKKKENFIPKSEILQKSLNNPNEFLTNPQDSKKEKLSSILNYYDNSPKKSQKTKETPHINNNKMDEFTNLRLPESALSKLNIMQKINKTNSLDDSKNFQQGDFKFSNTSVNNLYHPTNISNSTDELFLHLNKKIDNFDVTNITQNSISLNVNHPEYMPRDFYAQNNMNNNNVYLMFDDDERQNYGQFNELPMTNFNYKNNNENFNFNPLNPNTGMNSQLNNKNKIFNTNMFKMQTNKNIGKNMASSYADLSDQEIATVAGILAKDQAGCRSLQKRIIENPSFANEILFYEIQNCMLDLINDSFGNYLIQKLIDNIDEEKIEWIIELISPYFIEICASPHGTRVVQKLIENLRSETLLNSFNSVFSQFVIAISKDPNANHIIHKYVYTIKYPQNQFLYKILIEHLLDVSTDKHGCCVMQKLIEAADPIQKAAFIEIVLNRTLHFMSDQFANYIIQYILSLNDFTINKKIAEIFIKNIWDLSKQKFSSNVIEKCFDHSNEEIQEFLVSAMIEDEGLIGDIITDMYGNYVLQKALAVARGENYMKMLRIISNNLDKLKTVPFGNKLLAKFLYTYKELPSLINNNNSKNMNMLKGKPMNKNMMNSNQSTMSSNGQMNNLNNMINMNNMSNMNMNGNLNYQNPMIKNNSNSKMSFMNQMQYGQMNQMGQMNMNQMNSMMTNQNMMMNNNFDNPNYMFNNNNNNSSFLNNQFQQQQPNMMFNYGMQQGFNTNSTNYGYNFNNNNNSSGNSSFAGLNTFNHNMSSMKNSRGQNNMY